VRVLVAVAVAAPVALAVAVDVGQALVIETRVSGNAALAAAPS